uniref:Pleckstrin homology domain containing A7 n=1 Tax=Coturnix japonica TaxID=93934 RepID=A0A8C2T1R2_COTJA
MAAAVGRDALPEHWSYGVCRDGRVFFIDDVTRSTSWLHPRTGEPVNSGHMIRSDLPRGWEEGFSEEGASYFIDHNQQTTSFRHPVTGQVSPENIEFILQEEQNSPMSKQQINQRPSSMVSESSTAVTVSAVDTKPGSKVMKGGNKVHSFGKREQAIRRNPNVPVIVRGWLHKQDSSGMRLWKRRWFVLADYCLFYYKDSREESVLGSIPLPSYVISPVGPEDRINRKFSFKAVHTGMRAYIYNKNSVIGSQAEHSGMRTYYFSADTQEDMNSWIRAMNQAALMQTRSSLRSLASDLTLTRQGPHPPFSENYHTLPKNTRQPSGSSPPTLSRNLPSDYKYAQDRVSHLKMSQEERKANKDGTVWQLYEWQQRQQFKHGSPTAPLYVGSSDFIDRGKSKSSLDVPRSISVPPSPSDIPPPGPPKSFLPRRPHTPAERLTVKPSDERQTADSPFAGSPRKTQSNSSTHIDRRSMPAMGYMTHTVSAPSLHGKSADDTYIQLKKDLEYLDLKVSGRDTLKERSTKPVKVAESDIDVKLSVFCEQDRILQDLEDKIRALKENKDQLESVLEVLHRQMEQYKDQPQHAEKISYQQRLLQEDLIHIRAEISKVSTEMENAWKEYLKLENDVSQLKKALQEQMNSSLISQEKTQIQKDLWRIEDVTAGLSANKANYKTIVDSIKNPVPSLPASLTTVESKPSVPQSPPSSQVKPSLEVRLYPQPYFQARTQQQVPQLKKIEPPLQSPVRLMPKVEDEAPPRPPLPQLYSPEDQPPAVPPLPREATVIRHTSVRGLKRQSDERKRDRELGQYVNGDYRVELRSYVSEPELAMIGGDLNQPSSGFVTIDSGYQTLPTRGLSGSTSRLHQSSTISSYATLRRDRSKERPKSALERLYSGDHQRGKMSAEEQLERMKRHQKALVRERKRTLSQGERQSVSSRSFIRPISADIGSWKREQEFDLQLLERAIRGEDKDENEWLKVQPVAVAVTETDLEPQDYDLDISRELSKPEKVAIPERYVELEPEEPLSTEELAARQRKAEKIKNILTKSSMHNLQPTIAQDKHNSVDLDSQLQEQERIITISYALASEASQRSKEVAGNT